MNKKETAVLEQIIQNCKSLNEADLSYVIGVTDGMARVGGKNIEKEDRR